MSIPFWVQDAIFYQIFPDRFANGDPANDPPNVQAWGSPPTAWGFQGGDLRGILQHFDYLLDLGITAIYLNPIFCSPSPHRYNTSDYYRIDPLLGTRADFKDLLDHAHRNGVRLVLDGVFNHVGRGFFAFVDVLENGVNSPYRDWFHIKRFPLDAYGDGPASNYVGWWDHKSLPKLNTTNRQVRKYLLDVARYWAEQGIDGWRLDVPNEIDDDEFWEEFHQEMRAVNPDFYLLGEIWEINPRWTDDHHFDGLMNYPVRNALLTLLQGKGDAQQFAGEINAIIQTYHPENLRAMYVPLDSHDTERFRTLLGGNATRHKLALLFQMAFPGAPAIYYGDEIGLEGGKDPDSRRSFSWKEADWDQELRNFIKTLVMLRKQTPCLRRGEYHLLQAEDRHYVFARTLNAECVLVALNASAQSSRLEIPVDRLAWKEGRVIKNLLSKMEYTIQPGGKLVLDLPAWGGVWIA
jgi:cyclomaltodextrinase